MRVQIVEQTEMEIKERETRKEKQGNQPEEDGVTVE